MVRLVMGRAQPEHLEGIGVIFMVGEGIWIPTHKAWLPHEASLSDEVACFLAGLLADGDEGVALLFAFAQFPF
jgi:hypothetical protein